MPDEPYKPHKYWGDLVVGDAQLQNVGHPGLGRYNEYAYRFRRRAMNVALAGVNLPKARIFEAAYGEGFYLHHWRELGAAHVAGMDISPSAYDAAKRRFPDYDLRCGDLSDPAAFAGLGHHDLVTAIDVLYHIVDDRLWAAALDNLLSLVDGGGRFLFTDKFPRNEPHQTTPHVRRRPLAQWESFLRERGFEIARRIPIFVFMDDPITCGSHPLLGRLSSLQWRVGSKLLRTTQPLRPLQNALASLWAAAQAGPEWLLVNTLRQTPNLELAVCRRTHRSEP